MSVGRGTVFGRTRLNPALEASVFDRLSPYRVNRIIGVFGRVFRSSDAASKPFMTGIERSKIITSGLIYLAT
jgi:hypothetical protein